MKKILTLIFIQLLILSAFAQKKSTKAEPSNEAYENGNYSALKATAPIVIDGKGDEKEWNKAKWAPLKHIWLGEQHTKEDFEGKYKLLWDENKLYFLVEVKDDSLSDQHKDAFDLWWEDDCLELFIDEDNSDGYHQYDHNAFAYHITLDGQVVDMGQDQKPHLYNNNLTVKWTRKDKNTFIWEVAMNVYNDKYVDDMNTNIPVKLYKGKKMGFAVSYNDNDGNNVRENFVGSVEIKGEDKNRGWIDAGVFGTVELIE